MYGSSYGFRIAMVLEQCTQVLLHVVHRLWVLRGLFIPIIDTSSNRRATFNENYRSKDVISHDLKLMADVINSEIADCISKINKLIKDIDNRYDALK